MVLGVDVYVVTVGVRGCVQHGATPILSAALQGRKECIEMLAGLGGDVNKARTVRVDSSALPVVVVCGSVCSMLSWVSWC